ncbi:NucA/NucB deoxyribonuclease domain-containing protein [Prauserella alba]|uniref:NucA/NucB deoxyribonuclease domain-containing protein n=2 Tax=Prauserella alba TaxID=176898 RepID=UPI0020A33AC3|nr:NucA/NucB deoxyribonuclease domain-containing protein [Prauserella alba]
MWDATVAKWWKNTGQSWWRGAARVAGRIGDHFDGWWSSPGSGPNRRPSFPGRAWTYSPDGGPGGGGGWLGNGGGGQAAAAAAAAAARAYQAWLAARRQRVIDDAMTPHALPDASKQPVIAPSVQRAIDAAEGAPPVHLGVLNPTADDTDPYQPQQTGGAAEPDGIQTSHLLGEECATGGQVQRHGTGWECTVLDGDTAQPGTLSSDGDQPYGFRADTETTKNVPTVTFSRSRAPGIAQNFDNAVANGAPTRLTRVGDAESKANRRSALRGRARPPAGQSLDEYPFACSEQGGCGSFVTPVPVVEQHYQGGVLSRFFQDNGVDRGDPFDVTFGP